MKKLLAAISVVVSILFLMPVALAEIRTFDGMGEYILGELEDIEIGKERAKELALRSAQEKASFYLKNYCTKDMGISEDEIPAIADGILNITSVFYEMKPAPNDALLVVATLTAEMDTNGLKEWLSKNEIKKKELVTKETPAKKIADENNSEPNQKVEGQTYEGVGEYRMGSSDTIITAEKGAKILAMQDALEKAGIFLSSYAQVKDFELDKDVITTKSCALLKVIEAKSEWKDFVVRILVKVNINVVELNKWLEEEAKKSLNQVADF